ncbi:hypothetical protein KKG48_02250 [Patescibacteria group bacterium]|nr:hypothetical protein [Patescibacteria group bacterium]MCG2694624.1 hypothetical protein [Candidatus Parcubacteria bacterium]
MEGKKEENGWVIESKHINLLVYLVLLEGGYYWGYVKDEAVRFYRKIDAEQMISFLHYLGFAQAVPYQEFNPRKEEERCLKLTQPL